MHCSGVPRIARSSAHDAEAGLEVVPHHLGVAALGVRAIALGRPGRVAVERLLGRVGDDDLPADRQPREVEAVRAALLVVQRDVALDLRERRLGHDHPGVPETGCAPDPRRLHRTHPDRGAGPLDRMKVGRRLVELPELGPRT